MFKHLIIILSILSTNIALASNKVPGIENLDKQIVDIIDPPSSAALNIMVDALTSLKELKKQNKATPENVEGLIRLKLLPNIAMGVSTKIALSKHWDGLSVQQKKFFQHYITESLIRDYVGILSSYKDIDSVQISVDPKIKRKDNKAIVKLVISINNAKEPFVISLKMIRLNSWSVYDVVFSGVSVVKNYKAQFNSYIKRKGIDALIKRSKRKLDKANKK